MRRLFASLRVRLLLLVVLAFLPSLILTLYTAAEQRQRAEVEVQQTALRLVRLATSNQNQLVEGARQLLVALGALPAVRNCEARNCTTFFATLLEQYPLYANLWAVDTEEGNVFCSAIPFDGPLNVADDPYYRQTIQARGFTGGEYTREPVSGAAVMPFGYPVPAGWESPLAAVFAGIDLNWLYQFVAEAGLPPGSTLTVIDRNGMVLTRYPDPEKWVGNSVSSDILQTLLAKNEGVSQGVGVDGVPRIYAHKVLCCLASGNVYVRVGIPVAEAFAESNRVLQRNLLALGAVSVFALLAAWFGGNAVVVREVQHLVRTTRRLAAGDFGARTGLSQHGGELGQLTRSLDQMAMALEMRESERRETEQALRQHSARTEALARAAGRLNTQLDLPSVLATVCSETASALNVPAAGVGLYDPQADVVRCAASCGLPVELQAQMGSLSRATIESLAAGGVFQIADTSAAPDLPQAALYAQAGIRSLASATMLHEGELVGCLAVYGARLGHEELGMLRGLADQAALAISNARLYEALQREQRACEGLLAKVISAQEEERKRIARELHDETSQSLNALILSLDRAEAALRANRGRAEQHVSAGKGIAEGVLGNVHRLVSDLRPSLLDDLGLVPAISWYGEERLKPLGVSLSVQCHGAETRLPAAVETALFRIAQEAMTNIARHANASEVRVTLDISGERVRLAVEDNGRGFDVASVAAVKRSGRGLGLRGMQERAAILGGECHIQSSAAEGTRITVEAPLPNQGQGAD